MLHRYIVEALNREEKDIVAEIVEDLEAALQQFAEIAADLKRENFDIELQPELRLGFLAANTLRRS
jgi:hypothetical protein